MPRPKTARPWLLLLVLLGGATPLAAQPVPFQRLRVAQPYDVARGAFVPAGGPALALGVSETLVYDNADETGSYEPNEAAEIFMDWGRLTGFGENAITRMVICYGTTNTGNVTVTVRLHQGLEDQADPGAGLALELEGLPGSFDGDPIAWQVPLLFSEPLYLRDGPLRYSLQGTDGLTGPALVNRNEALEISDTLQFFSADGVADATQDLGSGGDPASVFTQLWALPHGDVDPAPVQAPLSGRDQLTGVLPAGGSHVFRLDSLPGELLTVQVKAGKGSDVLPRLAVHELAGGALVASAGDGSQAKASLKKLALPGGAVSLTLDSLGGGGSYRLKVGARPAKASLKPPVDGSGQSLGGLLASVEARAGTLVTAKVRPQTKGLGVPPRPLLLGPLGEVAAEAWELKGKGTWSLKKVPLPLRGPYELRAGSAEGDQTVDQPVGAKLSLKPPKTKPAKRDLAEAVVAGHWLRDGFLTEVERTGAWFRQGKGKGQLVESQANPEGTPGQPALVQTSQLSRWDVEALDGDPEGQRRLTYRVQSVDLEPPLFPVSAPSGEVAWLVTHPGGDTDLLVRDGGGSLPEVWRRDRQGAPPAPAVAELGLEDWPGGGPQPVVLAIEEQPGVVRYDVYKAGITATVRPARPVASLPALPVASSGEPSLTLFSDLSSLDGVPATYWVVAQDADGRRGPASLPLTVF